MYDMKTIPVSIRVPADTIARVDLLAEREHRSRSNMVAVLLDKALAAEPYRRFVVKTQEHT